MKTDNDPNIVYGGDFLETMEFASLGELFVKNFSRGGDKPALVIINCYLHVSNQISH
jgi:hypothetical protein